MSRSRKQWRAAKSRRHAPLPSPAQPRSPIERQPAKTAARVVIREASYVERLAYTRSQAAEALGISRSTLRRLLPYIETIEMPWGGKLIPVDELERLLAQRRQTAAGPQPAAPRGRKPSIPGDVVERIIAAREAGESFTGIAAHLNADGVPTAHGGRRWWASSVRSAYLRAPDGTATRIQDGP